MKDLYSFHIDLKDLDKFYEEVCLAYQKIFRRCGLEAIKVEALTGPIGGRESHEFMVLSKVGEDKVVLCGKCDFKANLEFIKKEKVCPHCNNKNLKIENSIELAHTFKLCEQYSKKLGAYYITKKGSKKPTQMGCYGIGLGRLMAAIVEVHNDKDGIIWPKEVSPGLVHLIFFDDKKKEAQDLYNYFLKNEVSTLYDDRKDASPGEKLYDADLIGLPWRVIVSKKTLEHGGYELKKRGDDLAMGIYKKEEILKKLKSKN